MVFPNQKTHPSYTPLVYSIGGTGVTFFTTLAGCPIATEKALTQKD